MSENSEIKWYVVHTYSGYENKVKVNLEKSVENNGLQDKIVEVCIPVEEAVEIKNNKRRTVQHKLLPGYVLVKMQMTDETWYIVRNTRGVTGFVGPGSKPEPLSDAEVEKMGVEKVRMADMDVSMGDHVSVKSGPLEGFSGTVEAVDKDRRKITVRISMFGKETPVEIDYSQISKLI